MESVAKITTHINLINEMSIKDLDRIDGNNGNISPMNVDESQRTTKLGHIGLTQQPIASVSFEKEDQQMLNSSDVSANLFY